MRLRIVFWPTCRMWGWEKLPPSSGMRWVLRLGRIDIRCLMEEPRDE
jgi:hypothetical protein